MSPTAPEAGPHRPYRVGLTGGIASGKSTVANEFRRLGVEVYSADDIARELVVPGSPLLADLVHAFGPGILTTQGELDRARLRETVFADSGARARLNALMHPAIRARLFAHADAAAGTYVVLEIPLLVEGGLEGEVDRVLVVDCPESVQLERLTSRDRVSAAQAMATLSAQATRADRRSVADDIVENSGSTDALRDAVRALHDRYRALAGSRR